MKKILIAVSLMCELLRMGAKAHSNFSSNICLWSKNNMPDGWYNANVKYLNKATGYKATYTLKVKVVDDIVVEIQLSNGGSLHTGINKEGYLYSGGGLLKITNTKGDMIAMTTEVIIIDDKDRRYFEVNIYYN